MSEQAFPFKDLQKECEREVTYRRRVYARLVETGRMTQEKADLQIARMQACADHFKKLAESQAMAGRLI